MSFLTKFLEKHLVSIHKSGEEKIIKKLKKSDTLNIGIVKKTQKETKQLKNSFVKDKKVKFNKLHQKAIAFFIKKYSSKKHLKKFNQNPKIFFRDSKRFYIRILGKIW